MRERRIRVADVRAAYARVKLSPVTQLWLQFTPEWVNEEYRERLAGCCPAAAIELAKRDEPEWNTATSLEVPEPEKTATRRYGKEYIDGFVCGVDGQTLPELRRDARQVRLLRTQAVIARRLAALERPRFRQGLRDGQKVRRALKLKDAA